MKKFEQDEDEHLSNYTKKIMIKMKPMIAKGTEVNTSSSSKRFPIQWQLGSAYRYLALLSPPSMRKTISCKVYSLKMEERIADTSPNPTGCAYATPKPSTLKTLKHLCSSSQSEPCQPKIVSSTSTPTKDHITCKYSLEETRKRSSSTKNTHQRLKTQATTQS